MSSSSGPTYRDANWWRARGPELLVAFATLVALGLGVFRLGRRPFWLDEATRFFISDLGWDRFFEVIGGTQHGWHPATYFMLLKPWRLLGDSEPALRALSVAFAVLAVPVFFLAARTLTTRWSAALGALLLAVNAYFVHYAQDVSPYSMTLLLTCASFWLMMRATRLGTPIAWAAYAVVAVVGIYTHLFFALIVMAQAAAVMALPSLRSHGWRLPLMAFAAVIVFSSPLAARGLLSDRALLTWVSPVKWADLQRLLRAFSGGTESTLVLYASGGLLAAAWAFSRRQRPDFVIVLLLWALLPPLTLFVVSMIKPLFVGRYLITALPALVLLAAIGFTRLPVWAAAVLFAMTLLASAYGLADWYTQPYQNWRAVATHMSETGSARDVVVLWERGNLKPLTYQVQRLDLVDSVPGLAEPPVPWDTNPYSTEGRGSTGLTGSFMQCRVARVWLVGGPARLDQKGSSERGSIARLLTEAYRRIEVKEFGRVTLRLYERDSQPCPSG